MAVVAQSLASHFSAKKSGQRQQEQVDEQRDAAVVEIEGGSSSVFQFAFDLQSVDTQQSSSKKKQDAQADAHVHPQVDVGGYIAVEDAGDLLAQLLISASKSGAKGKSHVAPSTTQASVLAPAAPKQQSTATTESANTAAEPTAKKSKKKKKKAAKKQQQQAASSSTIAATPSPATSNAPKPNSSTKVNTKPQAQEPAASSPSFLKLRKATGFESEIAKMQLRYGRGRRNLAAIAQRKKKSSEQPFSDANGAAHASESEENAAGDAGATEFKFNFGT